jgi:hypothetical protein
VGARPATPLSGFARSERLDIRRAKRFTAYCPIAALELVDANPGNRPHILALHLDHGLSDFRNQLLLLRRREYVFDHINRNEWHLMTLQ